MEIWQGVITIIVAIVGIFKGPAVWDYFKERIKLRGQEKQSNKDEISEARREIQDILERRIKSLLLTLEKKTLELDELRQTNFDSLIKLAKYEERLAKHMAKSKKRPFSK